MLDEGDLVWLDFEPARGNEQGGYRPALVLTNQAFHATHSTAIVCPITRNLDPWPTKVPVPDGLEVRGAILVEHVQLVARRERGMFHAGRVPPETLSTVRLILADVLGIATP